MSAIPIEQILSYINQARTNPKMFSEYVKKEMDTFINPTTLPLIPGCNYATNEGKGAWQEAYDFLINQPSVHPYELNDDLSLAAMDHCLDMQKNNFCGHTSSNGESFVDRIHKRCGQLNGAAAQNIGNEFDVEGRNHALQTVMGLIIDDGVASRGHRKNIFNSAYKYIGIYCVRVQGSYRTCLNFHSIKYTGTSLNGNSVEEKRGDKKEEKKIEAKIQQSKKQERKDDVKKQVKEREEPLLTSKENRKVGLVDEPCCMIY